MSVLLAIRHSEAWLENRYGGDELGRQWLAQCVVASEEFDGSEPCRALSSTV